MNKTELNNKLQYVFEGLEINKKRKAYLIDIITSIIDNAVNNNISFELKQATSKELGGIKIGYIANGKNYPIVLDAYNKAYVSVPWTNTEYSAATNVNLGLVKQAANISIIDGAAELSDVINSVNALINNLKIAGIISNS